VTERGRASRFPRGGLNYSSALLWQKWSPRRSQLVKEVVL